MTREEAIAYFKRHIELYCVEGVCREAEEMAIKALQQEPCEDAISRQAVRHILNHEVKMPIKVWKKLFELVDCLPPVTPQPKTGHWLNGDHCSECGCDIPAYIIDWRWEKDIEAKYCPNCGAKMIKPQESEGLK